MLVCAAFLAEASTTNAPLNTFDLGTEDWTVGNLFSPIHGSIPEFISFGGVSGGYIETVDIYGFNAFRAPSSWLGDQSARYGDNLHVSQRAAEADAGIYPLIVLASGFTWLQYRTPAPGTNWTEFVVPFVASAGWEIADGSGNPGARATEQQLQSVLANLDWVALNADWHTGDDLIGLDGAYFLSPPPVVAPETGSLVMAGAGLLTLAIGAGVRRRLSR